MNINDLSQASIQENIPEKFRKIGTKNCFHIIQYWYFHDIYLPLMGKEHFSTCLLDLEMKVNITLFTIQFHRGATFKFRVPWNAFYFPLNSVFSIWFIMNSVFYDSVQIYHKKVSSEMNE